jgi:hypothetical protein
MLVAHVSLCESSLCSSSDWSSCDESEDDLDWLSGSGGGRPVTEVTSRTPPSAPRMVGRASKLRWGSEHCCGDTWTWARQQCQQGASRLAAPSACDDRRPLGAATFGRAAARGTWKGMSGRMDLCDAPSVQLYLLIRVARVFARRRHVHTVPIRPCTTLPRGPNDSPDHTDTPVDCHEQQVAWVRRTRPPRVAEVGREQPLGPVRGGGVSGRIAAPTTAESASIDGRDTRHGRQHVGAVIGAHPQAAHAAAAPAKYCVCQCHHRAGCSA